MFEGLAKLQWQTVQYKGGGPSLVAVLSGEGDFTFSPLTVAIVVAISSEMPSPIASPVESLPILLNARTAIDGAAFVGGIACCRSRGLKMKRKARTANAATLPAPIHFLVRLDELRE